MPRSAEGVGHFFLFKARELVELRGLVGFPVVGVLRELEVGYRRGGREMFPELRVGVAGAFQRCYLVRVGMASKW